MGTTFTFGATPTTPTPLIAPATMPAMCVPWNWLSVQAVPALTLGPRATKSRAFPQSTLALRSTCVESIPESMMPTSTCGDPAWTPCDEVR
jgi:hypothetical protein